MPARFKEVVQDLLYRGGSPKKWEVPVLKNDFGIKQIISLDKDSGKKIDKICAKENINHILIPINSSDESDTDLNIIKSNVTDIVNNIPTYVHCLHGKDRTGLFVAKYKVENGDSCTDALDDAISFGFGIGMDKDVIGKYINIIASGCKKNHKHVNIGYFYNKTKKLSSCDQCGMTKTSSFCNNCIIIDSLMKNADLLNQEILKESCDESKNIVDVERDILSKENLNLDEEALGGGNVVSDIFHVPENIKMSRKNRINILKSINKTALSQVSFVIPEQEKKTAKQCVDKLEEFVEKVLFKVKLKDEFVDLLDIMYNPFNENSGITVEQSNKLKSHINIFTKLLDNNVSLIKRYAIFCLDILESFNSDSDVSSMTKAFFDEVDNLDKEEKMFVKVLENTNSKEFQKDALNAIKILKKSSAQLKQLIDERIIPYLRKDILGENWTTEIKQDLNKDIIEQQEEDKTINRRR